MRKEIHSFLYVLNFKNYKDSNFRLIDQKYLFFNEASTFYKHRQVLKEKNTHIKQYSQDDPTYQVPADAQNMNLSRRSSAHPSKGSKPIYLKLKTAIRFQI